MKNTPILTSVKGISCRRQLRNARRLHSMRVGLPVGPLNTTPSSLAARPTILLLMWLRERDVAPIHTEMWLLFRGLPPLNLNNFPDW